MNLTHPFRAAAREIVGRRRRPIRNGNRIRLGITILEDRVTPSNTPFQIDRPAGPNFFSSAGSDSQGDTVVAYSTIEAGGGTYDVYAQQVDQQGDLTGDPILVNAPSNGDHLAPTVAETPDGRFVVVYWGDGPGADGADIWAERYNADGSPADAAPRRVNLETTGYQINSSVAIDADGNFVVAWNDSGQAFARVFSWDLQTTSADVALAGDDTTSAQSPRVAMAGNGTFVATYLADGTSATARQFGYAAGDAAMAVSPLGDPIAVDPAGPADTAVWPAAAADGSFVTVIDTAPVYSGDGETYTESMGIEMRHFAADGTPVDAAPVPVTTAAQQWTTGAGLDDSGNLYVSWHVGADWWNSSGDGYVREFDPTGAPLTDAVRITPQTLPYNGATGTGSLAVAGNGSFLVGWTQADSGGNSQGVMARHYDAIASTANETDTLSDASTGDQVQVTSAATTFADSVVWEYWVTNNGANDLGQFTISGQPEDVTDASNSLSWAMDSGDTGWTAGPSDPSLAPGATAYFTFTTPSAYAVQPVPATAVAGGITESGSVLGPDSADSETQSETTTMTPTTGEEMQVTSSATVFAHQILWGYLVTNVSYVGESGEAGVGTFTVPQAASGVIGQSSNVEWSDDGIGSTWTAAESASMLGEGETADFFYTTPLVTIGHVSAEIDDANGADSVSGDVLAPAPVTTTETDTLTNSVTGARLQVTATATEFVDHVVWEYQVQNIGSVFVGQFGIVSDPPAANNGTSSLGWAFDSNTTTWTAGPTGTKLAPGQTAYFSDTTSADSIGPVIAATDGGEPSGQILGPVVPDADMEPTPVTPVVWISASTDAASYSVNGVQGTSTGGFFIARNGDLTQPLTVTYSVSGDAVPGVDYVPLSGTVTIPAGQRGKTVIIHPIVNPGGTGNSVEPAPFNAVGVSRQALVIIQFDPSDDYDIPQGPDGSEYLGSVAIDEENFSYSAQIDPTGQPPVIAVEPMNHAAIFPDGAETTGLWLIWRKAQIEYQGDQVLTYTNPAPITAGYSITDTSDFETSMDYQPGPGPGTVNLPTGTYVVPVTVTPIATGGDTDAGVIASLGIDPSSDYDVAPWDTNVFVSQMAADNPPVAQNDDATTLWNSSPQLPNRLNPAAPGVLANDTDDDGDLLRAVPASGPSDAAYFHLYPNGSYVYVPKEGFVGNDSFTYRAWDGVAYSDVKTVTIAVTDTAPAGVGDYYQVQQGDLLNVSDNGVLDNDSDPDGDSLSAVLISAPQHAASGSFQFNSDGTFQYKPDDSFSPSAGGVDTFTYEAYDGALYSSLVTVTLTVLPQPSTDTIQLKEMQFADAGTQQTHWDMYSDTGTRFSDSQWQWYDKNMNGKMDLSQGDHAWPVAYVRGSTMAVTAVFQLSSSLFAKAQTAQQNGTLGVHGTAASFDFLANQNQITLDAKTDQLTVTKVAADTPLSNIVTDYKNLIIDWGLSLDGTFNDTESAGASVNPVYVLLSKPYLGNGNQALDYTVVDLGCTLGWGLGDNALTNKNALPDALMVGGNGFGGLTIHTVTLNVNTGLPPADGYDGDPTDPTGNPNFKSFALTYYGNWTTTSATTATLLQTHDGQCGAWARFFIDILAAQGAIGKTDTPFIKLVPTVKDDYMLVNSWTFPANPSVTPVTASLEVMQPSSLAQGALGKTLPQDVTYSYTNTFIAGDSLTNNMVASVKYGAPYGYHWAGQAAVTYDNQTNSNQRPLNSQNNSDPPAIFNNHTIVKIGNTYYDPSYGKTYASLAVIDDQLVSGFCRMSNDGTVLYIRKNPPNQRDLYEYYSAYGPKE